MRYSDTIKEANKRLDKILEESESLHNDLIEAKRIIMALLAVPDPATWERLPGVYKRATEFLRKE